jgi:hypothetical protein
MGNPFGLSSETTKELVGKTQEEVIDHLYSELDRCAEGDIEVVRTLLISLFAASIINLSPEETAAQLERVIKLVRINLKVVTK